MRQASSVAEQRGRNSEERAAARERALAQRTIARAGALDARAAPMAQPGNRLALAERLRRLAPMALRADSALPQAALAAGFVLHALFLVALVTGILDPLFVEASQGYGQASDFFGIYQAGANLLRGYSIYDSADYLHEAPQTVPFYYFYRYLPPTAYGAAALALLPPWPAYWVWVALNEALIALVVVSILRMRRWPWARRSVAAALWLGFFPLCIEQIMGQFSLSMAALLWFLWRADSEADANAGARPPILEGWRTYRWSADTWRPMRGAIAWALSLILKTFSIFLAVPYLRDARLKRLVSGFVMAAAVCIPYFVLRPRDMGEFVRLNLSPFAPQLYKGAFGLQTFLGDLLTRLPASGVALASWHGRTLTLGGAILLAASLLIGALALVASLRSRAVGPERHARDLALWVAVFFLVFKSVWEYHYVMILPALCALYLVRGSRTVLVLAILLGLPTLFAAGPLLAGVDPLAPLSTWPAWFRVLHFSVKCVPMLALFAWCLAAPASPDRETRGCPDAIPCRPSSL